MHPNVPERELFAGGATGSARPLVWAHAEFVKLCRSIQDGRVFDQPRQTVERYLKADAPASRLSAWRFNNKIRTVPRGAILRVETLAPATVHLGFDDWSRIQDVESISTGLGVWTADVDTHALAVNRDVSFTFWWPQGNRWEGVDFRVLMTG